MSVKLPLSTVATWSPIIIESRLRNNAQFQQEKSQFINLKAPSFKEFDSRSDDQSIQLILAFKDFVDLVEKYILIFLSEIGVSWNDFSISMEQLLNHNDSSCAELSRVLNRYCTFEEFGEMMEESYIKLSHLHDENVKELDSMKLPNSDVSSLNSKAKQVRVLWDIENVSIRRKEGGSFAVKKIQEFLSKNNLAGNGIDCRITAFFSPENRSISKAVIEDLDKMGIELVWVSRKREDADRKLGFRISQEMQVLHPEVTTFVIISSDQDFRHHMQLLRNQGFNVVIIHDAKKPRWIEALTMYSNASFLWSDVMGKETVVVAAQAELPALSDTATSTTTTTTTTMGPELPLTADISQLARNNTQEIQEFRIIAELGWMKSKCLRWKGMFGFLSVDRSTFLSQLSQPCLAEVRDEILKVAEEDSNEVRIYASYKALSFQPSRAYLQKNEEVMSLVAFSSRGLRALSVIEEKEYHSRISIPMQSKESSGSDSYSNQSYSTVVQFRNRIP